MSNKPGNLDNIEVYNQNNFPPLLLFLKIFYKILKSFKMKSKSSHNTKITSKTIKGNILMNCHFQTETAVNTQNINYFVLLYLHAVYNTVMCTNWAERVLLNAS